MMESNIGVRGGPLSRYRGGLNHLQHWVSSVWDTMSHLAGRFHAATHPAAGNI